MEFVLLIVILIVSIGFIYILYSINDIRKHKNKMYEHIENVQEHLFKNMNDMLSKSFEMIRKLEREMVRQRNKFEEIIEKQNKYISNVISINSDRLGDHTQEFVCPHCGHEVHSGIYELDDHETVFICDLCRKISPAKIG